MKSFYTILKLSSNIATDDSIAIGILMFNGEKFRYYFSDKKKGFAKRLLDNKNVNVNFLIDQIIDKCDAINSDNEELKLFYKYDKLSEISYFDYLSNYSNGLIQFSKPKLLFDKMDDKSFEKLVYFLFGESTDAGIIKTESNFDLSQNIIQKELIDKVDHKVHTHYKFTPELLPAIYFKYEIDCIGKNGFLVGAKSMSFDKSLTLIDKDISHYFTLISTLTNEFNQSLQENDFYLISEEPNIIGSKEHDLWVSVRNNSLISVIHPEESYIVAEVIFNNESTKFLKEVD